MQRKRATDEELEPLGFFFVTILPHTALPSMMTDTTNWAMKSHDLAELFTAERIVKTPLASFMDTLVTRN
jgi:hypothetical protein